MSVVQGLSLPLSQQGRLGITSPRRDARSLTVLVVIRIRVMQPGCSAEKRSTWPMAQGSYGMVFAPHHRGHSETVQSHLRCAHRLGWSLAGLFWKVRNRGGSRPPLDFNVRGCSTHRGCQEYLFPYQLWIEGRPALCSLRVDPATTAGQIGIEPSQDSRRIAGI